MQHNYTKTISKLTIALLATVSLASVAYAADLNQTQAQKRNPFTKTVPVGPSTLPSGLPNDLPPPNYNQIIGGASRDLGDTPEAREAKIMWENMKIVGIFNGHVLLRLDENDDDNNTSGSSNGGSGSNNNSNNNRGGNSNGSSNNNTPVTTIMTTLGDKFLLNKNYYTLKKEKDSYVIYNKASQPMHSMTLESNPTRLIPRINGTTGSGSTGTTGANSATK